MAHWPNYTKTRYPLLGYCKVNANLWRIVSLDWDGGGTRPDSPATIGPQYVNRSELLADLERYAREGGYKNEKNQITDTERLNWIENMQKLHRMVEFVYVPGGIICQITYTNGRKDEPEHYGNNLREAIDKAMSASVNITYPY